jgi:excisionase family DNA binding protein
MLSELPHGPRLLEVHEVAYYLKTSQEFVRRKIRDGKLAAIRVGAHLRVHPQDLEAYLEACRIAHTRPDDDRKVARLESRSA